MIIPDPVIDREKNACPMAITHVSGLSRSSQRGISRYSYPARAPSRKNTRTAIITNRMKNAGIIMRLTFSIPFRTPPTSTTMVITTTMKCHGTLPKWPVAWEK